MGGVVPDTPDSKRVQRWAPNASNAGEETTLQGSVEQNKLRPKVHSVEENISDDDESDMYVATIENSTETKDWKATIKVNDRHTTFKLDTGAQCNVISKKTYDQISKRPLLKSKTKLVTFSGHKLKACGKASMVCEYKQNLNVVEFEEVQQNVPSVLGLKACNLRDETGTENR